MRVQLRLEDDRRRRTVHHRATVAAPSRPRRGAPARLRPWRAVRPGARPAPAGARAAPSANASACCALRARLARHRPRDGPPRRGRRRARRTSAGDGLQLAGRLPHVDRARPAPPARRSGSEIATPIRASPRSRPSTRPGVDGELTRLVHRATSGSEELREPGRDAAQRLLDPIGVLVRPRWRGCPCRPPRHRSTPAATSSSVGRGDAALDRRRRDGGDEHRLAALAVADHHHGRAARRAGRGPSAPGRGGRRGPRPGRSTPPAPRRRPVPPRRPATRSPHRGRPPAAYRARS